MKSLTDIDRAIQEVLQVEPGAEFPARIRARVAEMPIDSRWPLPGFALAAIAGVVVVVVAGSVLRPAQRAVAGESMLPSRDLIVMSPAPAVLPSPLMRQPSRPVRDRAVVAEVLVSQSEMLALQRLFAGITVAPAPLPAPADELSIPKLEIEPLPPLSGGPEGDRQ